MKSNPPDPRLAAGAPTSTAPQGGPRKRGRRWLVAAVVVIIAGMAAGVAVFAFRGGPVADREAHQVREAIAAGRYEEALVLSERWLRERPEATEAMVLKAEALLHLDRPREAFEILNQARALGHPVAPLERLNGILMAAAGQYQEAEPLLVRAHERRDGPDPLLDEALAKVFLNAYRLDEAREALKRWAEADPDDPRPYLWKAEVDGRLDGGPGALAEDYRAVLQRAPSRDDIRLKLAQTLLNDNHFEESAAEFRRYLERHPDDPEALAGAGQAARGAHHDEQAADFFERALRLDPENPTALIGLAGIEAQRGDFEAALPRLELAKAVDPEDLEVRYRLASALDRLGRSEAAAAERKALDALRRDLDEMENIRKALIRTPNDPDLQYRAARWLTDHGHAEEALTWALRAIKSPGGHPPSARLLADYYAEKGNPGLANYYRLQADRPARAPGTWDQGSVP